MKIKFFRSTWPKHFLISRISKNLTLLFTQTRTYGKNHREKIPYETAPHLIWLRDPLIQNKPWWMIYCRFTFHRIFLVNLINLYQTFAFIMKNCVLLLCRKDIRQFNDYLFSCFQHNIITFFMVICIFDNTYSNLLWFVE